MATIKFNPCINYDFLGESNFDFKVIARQLGDVAFLYPNFKEWLYFRFKPDLRTKCRNILLAHSGNEICGLSLLKKSQPENKICTFYVAPAYRGCGIGRELMDRSLSYFEGNKVLITVSEERESELYPTLKSVGFNLTARVDGLYRESKSEGFYLLR